MSKKKTRQESRKKPRGCKTKLQTRDKRLPPGVPDVSRILKVPGSELGEECDEMFDPPLHSTAMSIYEDEKAQYLEHDESISNSSDNSEPEAPVTISRAKKQGHAQKSKNQLAVKSKRVIRDDTESEPEEDNMMPKLIVKSSVQQEEGCSPEKEIENITDPDDDLTVKIWHPNRLSKHVTELDVILDEFEKITDQYKQGVEMKICRKAIDSFYIGFRDQLINSSIEAEQLRKTKLKSVKVHSNSIKIRHFATDFLGKSTVEYEDCVTEKMVGKLNKKRLHLIEVKEELIRNEPQLKKLRRECTELKEKIYSIRNARQLLKKLKDLQDEYGYHQKKNPLEKVEYGVHSLPALLVESRRILGAESHFRNINSKLQQMLDSQK